MKAIPVVTVVAALLFGALSLAPDRALAGEFEDALAAVEAAVGPIGESNDAAPGSVEYGIVQLALDAIQAKADGDLATALSRIHQAEAMASGG